MTEARDTALKVLLEMRRGAWSDGALDDAIERDGLDRRDAALCTQLCYGILQTRLMLDYTIAQASTLKLNKIAPKVMEILRLGAYQLLFLDKIPASAAVNEAVGQAKRFANPRAAAFVNAVLRRIADTGRPNIPRDDLTEYLSITYSHPKPLVKLLLEHFGDAETEELLKANNTPAPTSIRFNTLKGTPDELAAALEGDGLTFTRDADLPFAATLQNAGRITDLRAFNEGLFTVQDTASQLDVLALDPQTGEEILDLCAAPGGKSFHIAAITGNDARIIACDIYETKLTLIDEGCDRLGITCIETVPIDATRYVPRFRDRFDRVLVDVPCSGLGVIRKKPDIRYRDLSEIALLPKLQAEILYNAGLYVKPGGTLVYSTCTILPNENEDIVRAFLDACPEFTLTPFTLPGRGDCDGMRTLLPHRDGTDGFFIEKLTRTGIPETADE